MEYRFHTSFALRRRGQNFGEFDGRELRSEDYQSNEEFAEAIVKDILELLEDDSEGMEDEVDEPDEHR